MKFEQKRSGIGVGAIAAAVIVVILIAGAAYFIFVPGSSSSTTTSTTTTTTTTTTSSIPTSSMTTASSTTSSTSNSSTGTNMGATASIIIPSGVGGNMKLNFQPATLTVAAGTTIVFTNQDTSSIHNIDFSTVPSGVTIASSPNTNTWTNNTYSVTLTVAGTYDFKCDYHFWMNGTIIVTGSATTTTGSGQTTSSSTTSSSSTTTTTSSSSSTTATTSSSSSSTGTTTGATATVIIPQGAGSGSNFSPASITVASGTTITFMDEDGIATHNVAFTSVPSGATTPAVSPDLLKGKSFQVTLTTPGTYDYECQYHSTWMQAVIIVTG